MGVGIVELRQRAHPNSMAWRKQKLDPRVVELAEARGRLARFGAIWATVDTVDPPAAHAGVEALFARAA